MLIILAAYENQNCVKSKIVSYYWGLNRPHQCCRCTNNLCFIVSTKHFTKIVYQYASKHRTVSVISINIVWQYSSQFTNFRAKAHGQLFLSQGRIFWRLVLDFIVNVLGKITAIQADAENERKRRNRQKEKRTETKGNRVTVCYT